MMDDPKLHLRTEDFPYWYIEDAVNDILPGLQMFARDSNLAPEEVAQYQVGSIVREPAFVDATHRFMGMSTTHRITILSNRMTDLTPMIDDAEKKEWGLCISPRNSRFKVLDVYESEGKTQILLLHLPNDERWRLFVNTEIHLDTDLVQSARERFDSKKNAETIPALDAQEWRDRVKDMIGFDDELNAFPLEDPLEERLTPLSETGFRPLVGNVVYLKDAKDSFSLLFGDNGFKDILAFVYIDEQAGLSAIALSSARVDGREIVRADDLNNQFVIMRLAGSEDMLVAVVVDDTIAEYSEVLTQVRDNYAASEEVAEVRSMTFLDSLRFLTSPDDISVRLVSEKKTEYGEIVWVRLKRRDEETIYGELLNEPQQDYGVHVGDVLPLAFQRDDEGISGFALADEVVSRVDQRSYGSAPIVADRPKREYAFASMDYSEATPEEYANGLDEEISRRMLILINLEAPIEKTWLCNRVRESFGINRSGSIIQAKNDKVLRALPHKETVWNDTTFVWKEDQDPDSWLTYRVPGDGKGRESNQIPYQEIVLAMIDCLGDAGLDEDSLIRSAASRFGFTKVASRIRSAFGLAIKDAISEGTLVQGDDGLIYPRTKDNAVGFEFAAGIDLASRDSVSEGWKLSEEGTCVASVSREKIQSCLNFYLCSQGDEGSKVAFFLETPCSADEEDELRKTEGDPLHYKVFYSPLFDYEYGIALIDRFKDVLLNDGLISFGFFSNDTQSQVTCDNYKVLTMVGVPECTCERIFDAAGVASRNPVTAWDVISPSTPGKCMRVEYAGKTIEDVLCEMERDFGVKFDRFEADEDSAYRVD